MEEAYQDLPVKPVLTMSPKSIYKLISAALVILWEVRETSAMCPKKRTIYGAEPGSYSAEIILSKKTMIWNITSFPLGTLLFLKRRVNGVFFFRS